MKKMIKIMLLTMIIPLTQQAMAQDYIEHKKSELHESREKLNQHIKKKHGDKLKIENISIKQTPHGPQGSIYLDVDRFGPKPVPVPHSNKEEREQIARKIARQFIEDEKELLDVYDFEEAKETYLSSGEGNYGEHTNIRFHRLVNGYDLIGSDYFLQVGADDKVSRVTARLIPISRAMFDAAHQKALSENEIIDIVINDLKFDPKNPLIIQKKTDGTHPFLRMDKMLIDKPPYAVWDIRDAYVYTINAITGEIIDKYLNITE